MGSGLGWYYWNLETSILNVVDTSSPENRVLFFFVLSFVFLCTGAAEYLLRIVLNIWIPLPASDFVALCSVANLSLIIFDEIQHGYYIHCQSPSGYADTDSEELKRSLEKEAHGDGRNRGLDSSDPTALQCFELYVAADMRRRYDGLFSIPLEVEIDHLQRTGGPDAIGK